MAAASLCSSKRSFGRAEVQRLQEVQCQPPVSKRKKEEFKENRDPEKEIYEDQNSQNLESEPTWFSKSRTRYTTCTKPEPVVQIQFSKPQVRTALIRKTMIQAGVQRGSGGYEPVKAFRLTDHQGSTEHQLDNGRLTRITESIPEVRFRSTADLVSDKSLNIRTRTSWRFERYVGPGSHIEKRHLLKTRSRSGAKTEIRIRKRRKVQQSAFRGRGQLHLSITQGAGHLNIHIYEARGLMGKSQRSCDSYVKLTVTSELGHRIMMKTQVVSNNKNPTYDHDFILCISDDLLHTRLLVSAFRRPNDSRCSQLIGLMSFGIGSLVSASKAVTGWFYLLGEEFGYSKHLRVTSQQGRMMPEQGGWTELTADFRGTPDSGPEIDPNRVPTFSAGPKDTTSHSLNCSSPYSFDLSNTNQPRNPRDCGSPQLLTVNIVRGKDGFGFTICSDCPVRVQAVDPGGPAYQSGLRQGDSVLQLNGLSVETWKCMDLAHTIRSSAHIVLVVWRGLPVLRSGCEELFRPAAHSKATHRKLLPHPAHSKHGRRGVQRSGVRSSLGALSSLWRDRSTEQEEVEEEGAQELTKYPSHTTTLKGTHVTSSNGDNYIILSPVNPGEQLLQSVYHDGTGTIGRLYQTHPRRGQKLSDQSLGSSLQPFTSCTSTLCQPSSASSLAPPSNYSNYQNCTMVQSHLPCSSYGTYVTLAPKTLIFPVFVQPLDLCSPNRTLLLSEEMILHQVEQLPAKVTVLIYSDLLLLTREDEAGRCNVLQSPLYLNTLQIREVSSEPLHTYILQNSPTGCRYLFSLESFSIEQKVKVSLCLHDNVQLQLITTEATGPPQLPDLPSNFRLLSLGQSDLLLHPSTVGDDPFRPPTPCSYPPTFPFPPTPLPLSSLSPYASSSPPPRIITTPPHLSPPPPSSSSPTKMSPIWRCRGRTDKEGDRNTRSREEQVEERQQAEGESASETSENVGAVGRQGFPLTPHFNMEEEEEKKQDSSEDEEEGSSAEEKKVTPSFKISVLRRSLSEGSLQQEPRSPRFLSDSTIHRLIRPMAFDLEARSDSDPRLPSPHALREQLTREEGSLQQMLLLFTSTKDPESRNLPLRMKTRSLAADVRSRLPFLRRRKNSSRFSSNSLEKALRNNRPCVREVLRWAENLEALLTNQYGLAVFRHFLRSEFSEENLDFWLAVERFKKTRPLSKMQARAEKIYAEFISTTAARQVNVDSSVRESTNQSLRLGVHPASFQLAQDQIFGLMETDSYPRFLRSHLYVQLTNQGSTVLANQSAGLCVSVSHE